MDSPKKSTTISAPVARMAGNKQKSNKQTTMSAEELKKLLGAQLKSKL